MISVIGKKRFFILKKANILANLKKLASFKLQNAELLDSLDESLNNNDGD